MFLGWNNDEVIIMNNLYVHVFTGRLFIYINEIYHEVSTYIEGSKLILERGYIKGNFVYIYKGELSETLTPHEGECFKRNGELIFTELNDINSPHFIGNIIELNNLDKIVDDIVNNPDDFETAETIEIVNTNGEVYSPTINPTDDFLKYVIKKAILAKRINLKNYKEKCKSLYDLNNMKSGLTGTTKMTVPYFLKWCEILGLDWDLTIRDNGTDNIAPLKGEINVNGRTKREEGTINE